MLGKRIIMMGEMRDPTRPQRWQIPGGSLYTSDPTEVFSARVAPYSLDSIVNLVASLSRDRLRDERDFRRRLADSGVGEATFSPFLLRRLVTGAIAERDLPDQAQAEIGPIELHQAERVLMDVVAASDAAISDGSKQAAWSLMLRALQHQYHDQLGYSSYKRELWLSRQVVQRALELGVDIEDCFRSVLNLAYSDLAVLSFGAYATIIGDESTGVLDRDTWIGPASPLNVPQEVVETYFSLTAGDFTDIQQWAGDRAVVKAGFEPYALSPIVNWPLVRRSDGLYVAPILRDLLERPTRGFPIDLRRVLSDEDFSTVSTVIGDVYEDYVKSALNLALPQATIHRGDDVLPRDQANCDFVVVEGNKITLVEAKSSRFSLEADMTKDFAVLRKELNSRGIGHGLVQLNESARAIRQERTEFPKSSILSALLVVRGEQVWLNSPVIREILDDLATNEIGESVFVKYQIVNDEGFDRLTRHLSLGAQLTSFIQAKCPADGIREQDFEDYIPDVSARGAARPLLADEQDASRTELLSLYGVDE